VEMSKCLKKKKGKDDQEDGEEKVKIGKND
jgi:hypothetical protein